MVRHSVTSGPSIPKSHDGPDRRTVVKLERDKTSDKENSLTVSRGNIARITVLKTNKNVHLISTKWGVYSCQIFVKQC